MTPVVRGAKSPTGSGARHPPGPRKRCATTKGPATFMIKEVSGDILLSGARAIVHGVAPGDHFDTGLALSLREAWPALAKDFRHYCHTVHPKSGEAWLWTAADGKRIVTLLTQDGAPGERGAGRPGQAHLEHVNHALRALKAELAKENIASVAFPAWACPRPPSSAGSCVMRL